MSKFEQTIKEAAMRGEELYLKLCTVDSVNETERTIECTPYDESAKLTSVDLQAMQTKTAGLLIVPKVGSEILVGYLDKNNAAVMLYTEIDKIVIDVENTIVINGGENNGLVKIMELEDNLKSIKDFVEAMNKAIGTGLSSVGAGNAANGETGEAAYNFEMTGKSIQLKNMENEKIKH